MKKLISFAVLFALLAIPFLASSSVEVVGSLKHIQTGMPGDTYQGQIKIQNSGDTPQEVKIYQTDLLFNYEDYTMYDEPVSHKRSNANWVKFSPATTIVNAQETQFIQYEITIPGGDSIIGTFWSVLMVEGVNPINPEDEGKLSINTITRYAIQLITEIGDKGLGELQFMEPSVITEGEEQILAIDIVNTGDHYIPAEVSIQFFDESGAEVKKLEAKKKGLLPNTSARF